MADFGEWLQSQDDVSDAGLIALKELAAANAEKWRGASLASYSALVATLPDASRNLAMTGLGQYHERWLQRGKSTGPSYGLVALGIGALILAGCLSYGVFWSSTFIASLGEIDQARGLITFLFAFGTIGIAIITSVSVIWMDVSEIDARITKAKDLLAILMGVLGTIVGYYFGTASGTPTKVAVAEVTLLPASTAPGSPVTVSTQVTGGAGPYHYDIIVTDPTNKVAPADVSVLGKVSATGAISERLPVPKEAAGNLDVKISVVDNKGVQGVSKSATLKVAAPTEPAPNGAAGSAGVKAQDGAKGSGAGKGAGAGNASDAGNPPGATDKPLEAGKSQDTAAPPAQPAPGGSK